MIRFGIDEVGRGCVFGPACMAAVTRSLDSSHVKGVRDSKKIKSERRRQEIAQQIRFQHTVAVVFTSVHEINSLGIDACISKMVHSLVERACEVAAVNRHAQVEIIVDGDMGLPEKLTFGSIEAIIKCVPHADRDIYECSAASILAKVARDNHVNQMLIDHPELSVYGLATNKGYATAEHTDALIKHGLTGFHRKRYCETLLRHHNEKNRGATPAA